jgi:glycosyltransferase involved in cell wall biosynthesis
MVLHGGNLPKFIEKYPGWTKFALDKADVLVAPSLFLADQIGKFNYRIKVISNVVDIDIYKYRERSKISPKLFWMRSFHPVYNPEMAIKVLQRLRQRGHQATLTMAGKDKGLEKSLKQKVNELGLSENIRFAGFLNPSEKIKEFTKADIYLNTNRIDNMPVSVVEARALGLPVISTNVGGLPYLIDHKENGLIVPDEDFESMVKCIELLLDDPKLTQKISKNGRKLAEEAAWMKIRVEWEDLILQVCNRELSRDIKSPISEKTSLER